MIVYATDIPLIRLNWVAARASRRQANLWKSSTLGRSKEMLRENASDNATACGVMMTMAKLRLQIRHGEEDARLAARMLGKDFPGLSDSERVRAAIGRLSRQSERLRQKSARNAREAAQISLSVKRMTEGAAESEAKKNEDE